MALERACIVLDLASRVETDLFRRGLRLCVKIEEMENLKAVNDRLSSELGLDRHCMLGAWQELLSASVQIGRHGQSRAKLSSNRGIR